jgi:chromosome segregation ATPase
MNVHQTSPGLSSIKSASTLNHSLLVANLEDTHEKQLLEKRIYDLKLRMVNLEEQLFLYKEKELAQQRYTNDSTSEISDLKIQLEEKNLELEERSLMLIKAKNAMEIMRKELSNHQFTAQRQNALEEKMHSLKQMNEEVEKEYKSQLFSYEQEVKNLQQKLSRKDQDLTMLDDQFVSDISRKFLLFQSFIYFIFHFCNCFLFLETV